MARRPALPRRQADRVRTGGPCFFTVRPRARTARQTVGTLAGTTFCPRPPLSAQRRPERQPRLHTIVFRWGGSRHPSLNEGRSVNPGYTRESFTISNSRSSLNEGRSVNPGYTSRRPSARHTRRPSLNEGRSVNPGYTAQALHGCSPGWHVRSTKAGASTPATREASKTSLERHRVAQRRPERQPRLHRLLSPNSAQPRSAKASVIHTAWRAPTFDFPSAQRRPERQPRLHRATRPCMAVDPRPCTLNEGRSVNPGYTRVVAVPHGPPATEATHATDRDPRRPLNEGRSVNPGYTALAPPPTSMSAQRRPERQPRLHC